MSNSYKETKYKCYLSTICIILIRRTQKEKKELWYQTMWETMRITSAITMLNSNHKIKHDSSNNRQTCTSAWFKRSNTHSFKSIVQFSSIHRFMITIGFLLWAEHISSSRVSSRKYIIGACCTPAWSKMLWGFHKFLRSSLCRQRTGRSWNVGTSGKTSAGASIIWAIWRWVNGPSW